MLSVMKLSHGVASGTPSHGEKRARRAIACGSCRARKVKCDGVRPKCRNCLVREEKCIYVRPRRTLANSTLHAGPSVPQGKAVEKTRDSYEEGFNSPSSSVIEHDCEASEFAAPSGIACNSFFDQNSLRENIAGENLKQREVNRENIVGTGLGGLITAVQSRHVSPPVEETASTIAPPEHEHWEYHGPGSYLSICSEPGVQWVVARSGIPDFANVTRTFSREISHVLKLEQQLGTSRAPQPDEKTTWQYTKVFFDELPEAAYGIIIRASFEARLKAYWRDGQLPAEREYNSEWYALRNIIWAFGARAVHGESQYASTFIEASQIGNRYLENALSRLSDLICCRCSLTAIEALILMAFYAEGVGCPSIEYMLCSNALRLAYSKGLHRQPGTTWNIPPDEIEHRNTLFWVIYMYEKHIAYRSGRPSAIDDNDISCQLPAPTSANSEFCWFAFKHAQISSRIAKQFHTVQAYLKSPETCMKTAMEIENKLTKWKEMIPASMQPGMIVDLAGTHVHLYHLIYLHCSYYGSLISIHSIFTNPWSPIYAKCQTESLQKQVERSSHIVADASRNIILVTRYVNDILAGVPIWLAMYYPILGLINLFVHILRNPYSSTVMSDIALLEVVAGHLARLEFASGGKMKFSFAREVSNLSRKAVQNAQMQLKVQKTRNDDPTSDTRQNGSSHSIFPLNLNTDLNEESNLISSEPFQWNYDDLLELDSINYEIENCSILLPNFPPEKI